MPIVDIIEIYALPVGEGAKHLAKSAIEVIKEP